MSAKCHIRTLAPQPPRFLFDHLDCAGEQRTPGNLDPDEWRVLVDLVRLIKSNAPEGAKALPTEIVPAIEETVRAHFARPIDAE
jgi:hypothetical protein